MHSKSIFSRPIALVAIGMLICVGGFILYRFEPTDRSWYPKCILHQWTGLHCPGCGATRACRAIVHGDLWSAIRFNPMLIVGGPIIAALIWRQRRREQMGLPASPALCWTLFVVLCLYFIARNVPSPSNSPLAPPAAIQNVGS